MCLHVVLLRSDSPHHLYLESLLAKEFQIVTVIEETGQNQVARLYRQQKWKSWWARKYHLWRRRITGAEHYRQQYFSNRQIVPTEKLHYPTISVDWINNPTVIETLKSVQSDIVIVIGVSILKPETLEAAGETVWNIHGGWLPDYRGNHCYFFARYNRDFEKIGSTIHKINVGIDTGNIIAHVRPDIDALCSAEALYCSGEMNAFNVAIELLHKLETGQPIPETAQDINIGTTYRTSDRKFYQEIIYIFRMVSDYIISCFGFRANVNKT